MLLYLYIIVTGYLEEFMQFILYILSMIINCRFIEKIQSVFHIIIHVMCFTGL